jgi:hypothetical protein
MSGMGGAQTEGEGTSRVFFGCDGLSVDWILLHTDRRPTLHVIKEVSGKYY